MRTLFKKIIVILLRAEARLVLRKYKPKIIAITGSVGKTSAKDAIYAVMAEGAHTRKSEKSFNSEIGLPLTILGIPNAWNNPLRWMQNLFDGLALILFSSKYPGRYPEWLVLEVGADRPGDIKGLQKWLTVDVAVITRLPEVPVHVEFFSSPEEVVAEKASLIDALRPGGALILFGDEENVRNLRKHPKAQNVLTYGFTEGCDVRASEPELLRATVEKGAVREMPLGIRAMVRVDTTTIPVEVVGALGTHALLPALAGAAVGHALHKSPAAIAEGLQHYKAPPGRMHLVEGIKNTLVIDDTYNASPAACAAALDTIATLPTQGGRKIAVMGDMLELGRYSVDEHRKIGALAAKTVDVLITVGLRARDIAQGALGNGMSESLIFQYEDSKRAGLELQNMLGEGDIVLVKGSQSMRMERVVSEIMKEPERAKEELVRQDQEWIWLK